MSFQIRHCEMGVFQGEFLGLGFWHPYSGMAEQGFCEFPTRPEAEVFLDILCGPSWGGEPLRRDDLRIEPYEREESERLRLEGSAALQRRQIVSGAMALAAAACN